MSSAPDISPLSLALCFLLLLIPLLVSRLLNLRLGRTIIIAVTRMSLQLLLAGIYLKYLFQWNHIWVNIAWFIAMVIIAMMSVLKNSELNLKLFAGPSFAGLALSIFMIVIYFNLFVVRAAYVFEAKYFIVIGGMLLGNSLRGNIISVSHLFQHLKKSEEKYLFSLACGATRLEALGPYFVESIHLSLKPSIATMMTIGLVSIPGMMSGQLLGGSTPMVAIKYQITIMIAIFVSLTISVVVTALLSTMVSFNEMGVLRKDVFRTGRNAS